MSELDQSVQAGYQRTKFGIIPNDWAYLSLQEICTQITDGTHHTPKYVDSGVPFYSVENITKNNFTDTKYITEQEHKSLIKRCKPEQGDMIMSRITAGILGDTKLIDWDVNASIYVSLALLKFKKHYSAEYIYSYTKSDQFLNDVSLLGLTYATPKKINLNAIGSIYLPVPKRLEEQTAIANALSDIDALLTVLEKLIAKKQAIKTATMQQLLTGKKRLPEFALHTEGGKEGQPKGMKSSELGDIPEDWQVDKIDHVVSITTGNRNTQDKVSSGAYPFYVRSQVVERINTYSFDGEAVLTAGDGVGTGKIFHYINGKFDFHQRVYLMYNFDEKLDGYYFYIYFSRFFYERIMSMTAKSSVDSVRREMIADMLIILPSKKEQTAIATILSDMEEEVQKLKQRLEKTRQIKKGMMQELLTGRTRLPLDKD
ncbi:restriction endonuclease subunit S [Vibrio parahaemolyticus]